MLAKDKSIEYTKEWSNRHEAEVQENHAPLETLGNIKKTKTKQKRRKRSKTEAATRGVLCKKVFLEISQNSQGNTCARVSFLILY